MEVLPLYHILISLVDKTSANIQEEKKFYHLRFSLGGQKVEGRAFDSDLIFWLGSLEINVLISQFSKFGEEWKTNSASKWRILNLVEFGRTYLRLLSMKFVSRGFAARLPPLLKERR